MVFEEYSVEIMEEYRFERINEAYYKDLCSLSESAFGAKKDIRFFQKKMDTGYLGAKHLGYIAFDTKGQAAAFYGVYPYRMEYKGKQYLAAQSGDTMTHPAHGGKGLFTSLAKMTYQLAKQEGIQFIFGFPNKNSYPGFVKKLNWTHHENMINYQIRVRTIPLAGLAKRFHFLMPIYKKYSDFIIRSYLSDSMEIHNSVITENTGGVVRSPAFMQYKTYHKNYFVSVSKSRAWIKVDGDLLIGDLDLAASDGIESVLKKLQWLSFLLGSNHLLFPVSPGSTWDHLLKEKMESKEGIYIGYLDLQSGLPLENFKYVLADFDTF